MAKKGSILVLFILLTSYVSAQFVNFGQDRAAIRWKQIKTDRFQIIYPDFFEAEAQKAANLYERLYRHANTMRVTPKRISMILHADGGISNGNVALVPRKSELYTTPPQEPNDSWLEHLCTHEFRHVTQFDNINRGFTKALSYLFGELFPIAVTGVYVPMWVMEGDAVCFETSVGRIGRGRSPEFLNEMKAQVVEKGIYNYHKAVLGSNRDYVPNRYNMGYYLIANTRLHYGADLWAKALERSGRRPYSFRPVSRSLSLSTRDKRDSLWDSPRFHSLFTNPDSVKQANSFRNTKRTLYRDTYTELRQEWMQEAAARTNAFDTLPTRNKHYANYYQPTPLPGNTVIAYKEGLQESGSFVALRNGKEHRITRTAILYDYRFATDTRRILWSEYRPHVRWEQAGRMRLSLYDLRTGEYRTTRGANNQFAPFRAGDGWGYVETDRRNRSYIVLADSTLTRERWRLEAADGEHFIHPSCHNGTITTVVQTPKGNRLEAIDIATRRRTPLTPDLPYEIDHPATLRDTLFYRASYNSDNALYRLNGTRPEEVLTARYGIRFPAGTPAGADTLYFSFYTSDGYKPATVPLANLSPRPATYASYPLADTLARQENWQPLSATDSIYPTRPYRKFPHLFNIHSWAPVFASLSPIDFDLGATVYSQNKLSTLSFTAGFVRQSGYRHGNWLLDATYSGWWPVIGIRLESGREDYTVLLNATDRRNDSLRPLYLSNRARRSSANLTVQLPLNLSARHLNRSLAPYVRYQWEAIHSPRVRDAYTLRQEEDAMYLTPVDPGNYRIRQPKRSYQLLEYGLTFSNQTHMTVREIAPRWGQSLSVGYTHALGKGLRLGSQWWASGTLHVPGFFTNHSLSVYGGFQRMSNRTRNYSNKISSPRGTTLYGYQIGSLRASYRLPLLYPDWHIGSLLYFKQINGCLFYDFGTARNSLAGGSAIQFLPSSFRHDIASYGIELTTDTHLLHLTFPIHVGVRAGYETQTRRPFGELILSVGLTI